jgi:hypothetical protein
VLFALIFLLFIQRPLQWFRKEAEEHGDREFRFFETCLNQTKALVENGHSLLGAGARALEKQQKFNFTDSEVVFMSNASYAAGVTTVWLIFPISIKLR